MPEHSTATLAALMAPRIGVCLARIPSSMKALHDLDLVEIMPTPPLPRPATFKRWKEALGPSTQRSFVPPLEPLFASDATPRDATLHFEWICRSFEALEAHFLVLDTRQWIQPGQRDRARLLALRQKFADALPSATLVWQPAGLWELEHAARFAEQNGLVCAFDPRLEDAPPAANLIYARLRGVGLHARLTQAAEERMFDRLSNTEAEEIYVVLATSRSVNDALRLRGRVADAEPSA